VSTRITDSALYGHLWGTAETRAIFGEQGRLQGWLDVIAALARAQAAEGVIPAVAAEAIGRHAHADQIDLDYAAQQTRETSHSTLGLIRALQAVLPAEAREYAYTGASVQDITDTWTALAIRQTAAIAWRDLRQLEGLLLSLAVAHRRTVMAGRTHGQPGSPVTFGWKAASWADEIRRHLGRLRDGAPRWLVGQLGGGVGSLVLYQGNGLAVRARFCAELGLADPVISWLSSRDRMAEFAGVLAMVCGTLARIGTEVYELARPEIGELAEPATAAAVGSITMPHKRNPESSEHLDTVARLVRAQAGVLAEGMAQQHERDGRGWKAEWVALPEVCLLTAVALQTGIRLIGGLQVNPGAMSENLERGGYSGSEQILARLAPRLGARRAQAALQEAMRDGRAAGVTAVQAAVRAGLLDASEVAGLTTEAGTGACADMTDLVVSRARAARAAEPAEWP
jgi:adenylosuccinate lyase